MLLMRMVFLLVLGTALVAAVATPAEPTVSAEIPPRPVMRVTQEVLSLPTIEPQRESVVACVPEESTAAELAERAIRSRNQNLYLIHLEKYKADAACVREHLMAIALDARENYSIRGDAAYVMVHVDGPHLSEQTVQVLSEFLSSGEYWLEGTGVRLIPWKTERVSALVPGLLQVAHGGPRPKSLEAADRLARWDAIHPDDLFDCLMRGLEAAEDSTIGRALGSPNLAAMDGPALRTQLLRLLDGKHEWFPYTGPGIEVSYMMNVNRRWVVLVVASRLSRTSRSWMLDRVRTLFDWSEEEHLLARLCLAKPRALPAEDVRRLIGPKVPRGIKWAALRVLFDQDGLPEAHRTAAIESARRSHHRSIFPRMLGRWLAERSEEEFAEVLAAEASEDSRQGLKNARKYMGELDAETPLLGPGR